MSLYAAYAFNEGGGNTIIDYSGNGRNMTTAGTNSWVAGNHYANAFQAGASGSDGAAWDGGSPLAALSGDVTVMMWLKHTAGATTNVHAGGFYGGGGTARTAAWSYRNLLSVASAPEFTVRDSGGTVTSIGVNSTTADGNWHHAAAVYHSSGTIEEYVDGVLAYTNTPTGNPIGTTVQQIAVGSMWSGAAAQAVVQDLRAFNSALTSSDITAYMNMPVAAPALSAPQAIRSRYYPARRQQPTPVLPASGGTSANVTGVGAQVTAAGGIGTPAGSAGTTGVGAQVSVGAGIGTPSGSASITGAGALITTAAGVGALAASANVAGIGALVSLAAGLGTPAGVINGSRNVTGVGAVVLATAGAGFPAGSLVLPVNVEVFCWFQARSAVDAQATMEFSAGPPVQAGLVTLASDPWVAMYPNTR